MSSLSILLALVAQASAAAHNAPPPPPVIYDPNPGPYIVFTDVADAVDGQFQPGQIEVIDAAIRGWKGDGMDAFLICSRLRSGEMGLGTLHRNEQLVADALRARGAKLIAFGGWGVCPNLTMPKPTGHDQVEIRGIRTSL